MLCDVLWFIFINSLLLLFQIKTMRTPSSITRKQWSWTRAMRSTIVTGVWRTCAPSAMAMRWRTPRKPWSWTRTTLRATIGEPPPTWPWASLKQHLKITKRWDSLYSQHFNTVFLDTYWCTEVSVSKHIRLKQQFLDFCWSVNLTKAMSFVTFNMKQKSLCFQISISSQNTNNTFSFDAFYCVVTDRFSRLSSCST